uniref:Small ribosomal subunit protein mS33 n=1 Tax=Propithecus coquereli TaxID=379532 RepID=A0A2K6GQX2_PROCO
MSSLSERALHVSPLSAHLFGEVARPTDSKSMKVVKLFGEQLLNWYPNHNTYLAPMETLQFLGLYRDEHQDFRDEQMKGEEKRAAKMK